MATAAAAAMNGMPTARAGLLDLDVWSTALVEVCRLQCHQWGQEQKGERAAAAAAQWCLLASRAADDVREWMVGVDDMLKTAAASLCDAKAVQHIKSNMALLERHSSSARRAYDTAAAKHGHGHGQAGVNNSVIFWPDALIALYTVEKINKAEAERTAMGALSATQTKAFKRKLDEAMLLVYRLRMSTWTTPLVATQLDVIALCLAVRVARL